MKEIEIEVFRAGSKAARGVTPEHIAEVATFDCATTPLGICYGHPASDTPAAGTIKGLRAAGNSLYATVSTLTDAAIEGIKSGAWLNRSFAFFHPNHEANPRPGKWSPRHLGLLGAAAPGIPGMEPLKKALAFDAEADELLIEGDPADAIVYAAEADVPPETPVHFVSTSKEPAIVEKTAEQIAAEKKLAEDQAQLATDRANFAAAQRTAIENANSAIVDSLVAQTKVLPAEADKLKMVFNALSSDELTFSADDKGTAAAALASFISTAIPEKRIPTGKRPAAPAGEFHADDGLDADKPLEQRASSLTAKAQKLVKDEGLTFEAAIERVSNGGGVDFGD